MQTKLDEIFSRLRIKENVWNFFGVNVIVSKKFHTFLTLNFPNFFLTSASLEKKLYNKKRGLFIGEEQGFWIRGGQENFSKKWGKIGILSPRLNSKSLLPICTNKFFGGNGFKQKEEGRRTLGIDFNRPRCQIEQSGYIKNELAWLALLLGQILNWAGGLPK